MPDPIVDPQDEAAKKLAEEAEKNKANAPRTYSDVEVNAMIGREKKKFQDQLAKQIDELEEVRKTSNLGKQQAEKLAAKATEYESLLTEETSRDASCALLKSSLMMTI